MARVNCPDPHCSVQHDEDDLISQKYHMDACHPDIVAQRLVEAGFVQDPATGGWIDTKSSD